MPGTPLSTTIQRLRRSIYEAIRLELIDKAYIPDITTYTDDNAGYIAYETAKAPIIAAKGYCIELYNASNPQAKGVKNVPRIVIVHNQSLPGSIGGSLNNIYSDDPLDPTKMIAKRMAPQTADYTFDIRIISNSSEQQVVMHEIVSLSVPKRGYIKFYDDGKPFFIRQYSYRDIPDAMEGVNENIYMYEIPDVWETGEITIKAGIPKTVEITVETRIGPNLTDPGTNFVVQD